jgi:DNA-binding NarL/FixJ family response regulator
MTSVLLVDDHVLFRKRLREIFSGEPDLTVVGEACDSGTALALAAEHRPDVVLLDVEIPGDDPVDTMIRLLAESPMTGVVIMSPYGETPVVQELRAAGPRTWLLPTVTRDDLVAAVHGVRAHVGRAVVPLPRIRPTPASGADGNTNTNGNGNRPLSQRELEIVRLAAGTMTKAQIAEQLAISEATVKRHVRSIIGKLGVASLADAVDKATALHLITPLAPSAA